MASSFLAMAATSPTRADEATSREIAASPQGIEEGVSPELRRRCLGIIRDTLRDASLWPKVHAAEYLIWLDHSEGVEEVYLGELERSGDEPEYRIGIWRVLAQAATTPEARSRWIDRIVEAWRNPNSPDRGHATETLSKLGHAMPDRDRSVLARDAESDDPILQAFARWLELNSGRADGMQRLAELLDSEEATSRKLAAFALRWQDELPVETRNKLVTTALHEPADSPARLHLLSSAYVHAPVDQVRRIKEDFVTYAQHGTEADKTEMCNALAERVTRDDLPLLQSLLEDKSMDVRATAARAILELELAPKNRR
ncbi:MAG: hypothetical protein GX621_08090 [Pirellulaceae bacterium]|nr:hypothetical protein [Pirellulaceae bacterium]